MFAKLFGWWGSSWVTTCLLGLLTLVILVYYYWWKLPHPRYPPGVRGIPVMGALPLLGKFAHKVIMRWSHEKYGPVMSVRFGPSDSVVLNDYESVYEALVKQGPAFLTRPNIELINSYSNGYGFGFAEGNKKYMEVRHFTLKALRGFGIGGRVMEERVSEVAQDLVQSLQELDGKPTNFRMIVGTTVSNVIASIVLGKKFHPKDEDFQRHVQLIFDSFGDEETASYILVLMYFPLLRHIPPFKNACKKFVDVHFKQFDFCRKEILEHKKNLDENEPGDYIDAFLVEMKKHSPQDSWFHDESLMVCVADLFLAGTETSTSTIMWGVVVLINYPEIQEKLHQEITNTTGEALPSLNHRDDLPLLQAFIQEVYRCMTLVPLGVQHQTTKDVEISGYCIPKDTVVFTNIDAVHHDPNIWKNPSEFNIYRHIDKDGKFIPSKKVIPFGIGCRSCLGEKLARIEIFLFLANIIKRFKVLPDPESQDLPPMDDGITGFGFFPFPFKAVVLPRKNEEIPE
uniref:cytochrome P450 2A13 n=1 Tax=Ciona intestinalis TaxID=7719 RepID=UPI00089DB750|nr:cytochrome P450 2A13 [Ciona intestinalis]|eukprot:XP_002125554.2 cytochrome P450 2A13 [Ciona intestinalis]